MAVAAVDTRITPAQAFMEMRAQIGVDGQQEAEAPRVAEANILNVSDAGRLSAYDLLYNTDNHEISDNRMFGSHRHDQNDENSEQGKERKADTLRRMSDALGGGKSPIENWWDNVTHQDNATSRTLGQLGTNLMNVAKDPIGAAGRAINDVSNATAKSADEAFGEKGDVVGVARNWGESIVNFASFGNWGRSQEQIAADIAASGGDVNAGRDGAPVRASETQPSTTREEVTPTTHDVVAQPRPQAPDMFAQFGAAISAINPFDDAKPAPEREPAVAAPRIERSIGLG